jgi:uncharacterized protein (TIGR03437 family)
VSPNEGTACLSGATTCAKISLNLDPLSLAPGEYKIYVTISPASPILSPQTAIWLFRVTKSLISVDGPGILYFTQEADGTPPAPMTLQVTTAGDPAPFTTSVRNPQTTGEGLRITPAQGTTPATVTVTADPSALANGILGELNYVTITGPANSVTRQAMLTLRNRFPPPAFYTLLGDVPLTFWAKVGTTTSSEEVFAVYPIPDNITVTTDSGGNWLRAAIGSDGVTATVAPSGLAAGQYHGTITSGSNALSDYAPVRVSVNLSVWDDPPPVSISPPAVVFSVPNGATAGQVLTATSEGMPVDSTALVTTSDGNPWLSVQLPSKTSPIGQLYVSVQAANLPPGAYMGAVKITAPAGSPNSVTVPVTLNVGPALPHVLSDAPPLGVTIVNGASQKVAAIAPGEVVSIYGLNIGSVPPAGISVDGNGNLATNLNGARVLIGDVPAPLQYASQTQVNAVVPYEIEGAQAANISVEFNGTSTIAAGVPVVPSAPAIFTLDGSGQGQANVTNQDGSQNGARNPAARGSVIALLATGLGQTIPAGTTGQIAPDSGKRPALSMSVTIGDTEANLVDIGSAPGQVEGVFQLHVKIPDDVATGPSVPIVIRAGGVTSPSGVTIAVR